MVDHKSLLDRSVIEHLVVAASNARTLPFHVSLLPSGPAPHDCYTVGAGLVHAQGNVVTPSTCPPTPPMRGRRSPRGPRPALPRSPRKTGKGIEIVVAEMAKRPRRSTKMRASETTYVLVQAQYNVPKANMTRATSNWEIAWARAPLGPSIGP